MPARKKKSSPKSAELSPADKRATRGSHDEMIYPQNLLREMQDAEGGDTSFRSARSVQRDSGSDSEWDNELSESWDSNDLNDSFESVRSRLPGTPQQGVHASSPAYEGRRRSQRLGRPGIHNMPSPRKLEQPDAESRKPRQRRPVNEDRVQAEETYNDLMKYGLLLTVSIVIAVVVYYAYKSMTTVESVVLSQESVELTDRQLMLQKFTDHFTDLRPLFPSQSKRTWATVGAGSKSVFRTEYPPQPGVILLASSAAAIRTMNCLTRKLSEILTSSYGGSNPTVFNTVDHEKLNATYLKLKIDETFQSGLGGGNAHVAILNNLEKVPGHAAMMFHAYCDNESAPFKDAIIIFTMVLPLSEDTIQSMSDKELQRYVEARLQEVWEVDIGYDNTMALKSRVANGIGIVKAEKSAALNSMYC